MVASSGGREKMPPGDGTENPDESRRKTRRRLPAVDGRFAGTLTVAVVAADGRAVRTFPLNPGDNVSFGRAGTDVVLSDEQCSRHHFDVFNSGGLVMLRDGGSTNGTRLNGEQITGTKVLNDRDVIHAGNLTVTVRGSLSGASPQAIVEIHGHPESRIEPRPPAGATVALPLSELAGLAGAATAGAARRPGREETQPFLPGVWQVCEAVFDSPYDPPRYDRLVRAIVHLGGAARAALVRVDEDADAPVIVTESASLVDGPPLPIPLEIVESCGGPGAAVGISNVAEDGRYRGLLGEGALPEAAVVFAAVASLERTYGVLYTEWRRPIDTERTFMWVWSIAGQLGLLIDRNSLDAELRDMNARLSEKVEERTRELATAVERLSAIQRAMSQTGKLATIGELASSLVHEISNPLAAIAGNAQLISMDEDHASDERVQVIARQAMRAHRIVKNILSLSRRDKPKLRPARLRGVLASTEELVAHELNSRNVSLVIDLPEDLPKVHADPVQLEHVFINLIVNSCQAIGETGPGRVTISARPRPCPPGRLPDAVIVEVADSGPGLAPEIIGRVFEPFFTTKQVGRGTGLGLAICKDMVEALGGSVCAQNAAEGGAVFELVLPVYAPKTAPKTAPSAAEAEGPHEARAPIDRPRVLVVDDDRDVLVYMKRLLELARCEVFAAGSKDEALGILEDRDVDVLVTDFNMPGGGGPQLFREAREARKDFTGRVLFVSGTLLEENLHELIEESKACFLEKPFAASALVRMVKELASRGGAG